MRKIVQPLIMIVVILGVIFGIVSCQVWGKKVYFSSGSGWFNAFAIGPAKCPKYEANLYVGCYLGNYETIDPDEETETGEDSSTYQINTLIKNAALALMSKVYSFNVYAEDNNISLSEDEMEKVREAAASYYEIFAQENNPNHSLDLSDIEEIYGRYGLALKVYSDLINRVDSQISEDEARIMDAYVIFMSDDSKCQELEARIAAGDDFAGLAQVYSQDDKRMVSVARNTYPQEVEDVIFYLENGQNSGRIDASDGIYYVKCVDKYNAELSEANKQNIIDERQKTLITGIQREQEEKYYSDINTDFFDEMDVSALRLASGRRFFKIIEEALGYREISSN